MENNQQIDKKNQEKYKCDFLIKKLNEKLNENFKIISDTNQEKPDFIIENEKNEQFGVEVVRILDQKTKQKEELINKIIYKLKDELYKEFPIKYFISFSIDKLYDYTFSELKKQLLYDELKKEVIDFHNTKEPEEFKSDDEYLKYFEKLDAKIKYSNYKYIKVLYKDKLDLKFPVISTPNSWWSISLPYEILKNTILDKEKKIENYKNNTNIKTQWLLIVLDDGAQSTYSTYNQTSKLCLDFNSEFNEIFLLEQNELKYFVNNKLELFC